MTPKSRFRSKDLDSTERLAKLIAELVQPGQFLALCGELGAGKTTFTRALTEALGCSRLATSPTFAIFQTYSGGRLAVFHADLYRLAGIDELFELGWEEQLDQFRDGLFVVEWADKFFDSLPADRLHIECEYGEGEEEREFRFEALGPRSGELLGALQRKEPCFE